MLPQLRLIYTEVRAYLRANLRIKNSEARRLRDAEDHVEALICDLANRGAALHLIQAKTWRYAMDLCA